MDTQILLDVILSGGFVGRPWIHSSEPNSSPVDLVFCNPDLIWKSDFPVPRLGQGAFREAFQSVFKVRLPSCAANMTSDHDYFHRRRSRDRSLNIFSTGSQQDQPMISRARCWETVYGRLVMAKTRAMPSLRELLFTYIGVLDLIFVIPGI